MSELRTEGLPGLPVVELGHGIGCVVLCLSAPSAQHKPAATVLWARQARDLAAALTRQANYAEEELQRATKQDHSSPRSPAGDKSEVVPSSQSMT